MIIAIMSVFLIEFIGEEFRAGEWLESVSAVPLPQCQSVQLLAEYLKKVDSLSIHNVSSGRDVLSVIQLISQYKLTASFHFLNSTFA